MRYESIQQEKGLFTFYKEQQAEEDQIRRMLKKRKKGKSKKQKKPMPIIRQDASLPHSKCKEISMCQIGDSKELGNYKNFLRNVISKQNSQLMLKQYKPPSSFRLKTDPSEKLNNNEHLANFFIQKKLQCRKISLSNLFKQRGGQFINKTETDDSNNKNVSLQSKIQSPQNTTKKQQAINKKQQMRLTKGEKKFQSRSFLEKLKHLELNNKSNLISNRESLYVQDKQPNDLHQQNKKYFHQLISNFYRHSEEKNQTGYKMIKQVLKFPHIIKTDKTLRLKTQEQSPVQLKQKIMTPLKPFVSNRKEIKRKISNEKYKQIQQINWLKHADNQEGRLINLIDMSKDYSRQLIQSQQRVKKKRLVRSRLGLEL